MVCKNGAYAARTKPDGRPVPPRPRRRQGRRGQPNVPVLRRRRRLSWGLDRKQCWLAVLQRLQSQLARLDRERHEAEACAAALREDIAARELELARLAAEADAADASDDGVDDDEDEDDKAAVIAAERAATAAEAELRRAEDRRRPRSTGWRRRPRRRARRPRTNPGARRPRASPAPRTAAAPARRRSAPRPLRRDRRAAALEFVRAAGHLRGRGALDAGAAAPAGAGPSFSSRRPVWCVKFHGAPPSTRPPRHRADATPETMAVDGVGRLAFYPQAVTAGDKPAGKARGA